MSKIFMYSSEYCPFCVMAEKLLKSRGVHDIEKVMVDQVAGARAAMMARTGRRTVPQIYIGDTHVGGFDDLSAMDRRGELKTLLAA
jgi:glutaredoxin 3